MEEDEEGDGWWHLTFRIENQVCWLGTSDSVGPDSEDRLCCSESPGTENCRFWWLITSVSSEACTLLPRILCIVVPQFGALNAIFPVYLEATQMVFLEIFFSIKIKKDFQKNADPFAHARRAIKDKQCLASWEKCLAVSLCIIMRQSC